MYKLFIDAGIGTMTVLTILLVGIFFAAWKAPRWVKEIGLMALAFSFFMLVRSFRNLFSALREVAGAREDISGLFDLISPYLFFQGLEIYSIQISYAIIIYFVSLVIRMLQKPRL